jgi:hypothetical protein
MLIRSKRDRVLVQVQDVEFFFAPLTMGEKTELMSSMGNTNDVGEMLGFTRKVISKTLKDVRGLIRPDGSEYRLEWLGDTLTEDCLDDIMNLEIGETIVTVAGLFLRGVPAEGVIIHPGTGKPLEGVTVKKNILAAAPSPTT